MASTVTFALAGNPNCGKTTLFNALTGSRQHVGNYPGVTVEKREGHFTADSREFRLVDLPGMYSLTAYSADELAARAFLVDEKPSCVIDVADAGTLERSLYLSVQFLELGVPIILALNMMDEVRRRGLVLDTKRLSALLGVPVVETVARAGEGKDALVREAVAFASERRGAWKPLVLSYGADIDRTLADMEARIEADRFLTDRFPARWLGPQVPGGRRGRDRPGPADRSHRRPPWRPWPPRWPSTPRTPRHLSRSHHFRSPLRLHRLAPQAGRADRPGRPRPHRRLRQGRPHPHPDRARAAHHAGRALPHVRDHLFPGAISHGLAGRPVSIGSAARPPPCFPRGCSNP